MIFAALIQVASSAPTDVSALERSISALESCISALDSKAETLSNSAASLEPWSWVFTAFVALGVAMEAWVIWHEHREDSETWALTFFGVYRTLRPHFGRLIVEYVSVVLVAGGIVGELVVGIKIASINTQLRGVDVQLRSKNVELRNASGHLIALLAKQAEDERSARVKIEASVAWRELSEDQKKELGNALLPYSSTSGSSLGFVSHDTSDREAGNFAIDIANSLKRGKWKTEIAQQGPEFSVNPWTPLPTGVIVSSTPDSASSEAANTVCQKFVKFGFDCKRDVPFQTKDSWHRLFVHVERRPKGPQGVYKLRAEAEAKSRKIDTSSN